MAIIFSNKEGKESCKKITENYRLTVSSSLLSTEFMGRDH